MRADIERCGMLARRVAKQIALRLTPPADRKVAVVLFNFPPNAGAAGTAAFLSVFRSLWNTLHAMKAQGYRVEVPGSVDALRERLLGGNAARFGTPANVEFRVPAEDHVAREPWLSEIEAQWGPAPGRHQADGRSIFVLGATFGNVFVGLQPAFGYEGDPMRLLFERGFAPTHAFSAFYRYIATDFAAHAVLHFGTHGALEFMPGKQVGLTDACWPDRLIGDLPNIYLYAANNPSEGAIAKRRSAATLVSYLTPTLTQAGLYRGLVDLKSLIERWRGTAGRSERRARAAGADHPGRRRRARPRGRRPGLDRQRRCRGREPAPAGRRTRIDADPAWTACRGRCADRERTGRSSEHHGRDGGRGRARPRSDRGPGGVQRVRTAGRNGRRGRGRRWPAGCSSGNTAASTRSCGATTNCRP